MTKVEKKQNNRFKTGSKQVQKYFILKSFFKITQICFRNFVFFNFVKSGKLGKAFKFFDLKLYKKLYNLIIVQFPKITSVFSKFLI